jgi:hypothetical protein
MLVLVLVGCLALALCLIPRPFDRSRLAMPLLVLGFLAACGLGSWLLSRVFVDVGVSVARLQEFGVPPWLILCSPLLLVGVLGLLAQPRRERTARKTTTAEPEAYHDDAHWYSSHWRRNPANADVDLGTAGYRLELVDGPLAGRTARLRDSRFRLWVASPTQGGELIVRGAITRPELQGVTLLGAYEFAHSVEGMIWTPAPANSAEASA